MRLALYTLVLFAGLALAACGGKDDAGGGSTGGGAEAAAAAGLDRSQLTGTWTGDFGTLTFNEDGAGKIELRNCGFSIAGPGRYEMPKDVSKCDLKTYEGPIQVVGYTIKIGEPSEGTHNFEAYLAADGQLHFGIGVGEDVVKLDGKKGTVTSEMFKKITIKGDGTCVMKDEMKRDQGEAAIPCRFDKADGHEVFVFKAGDDEPEKGLVYLPEEDLMVPPSLPLMAFSRGE